MKYVSTRGESPAVTASEAIINGMAPDGGLYVPESWPAALTDWDALATLSYQQLAERVFGKFFDDFPAATITDIVAQAYGDQWDAEQIVPLHVDGDCHYLELFHGPTLAFKDIALQALPRLLTAAAKQHAVTKQLVILTATSGDTGSAAMAGFRDVAGTEIVTLYPQVGVSDVQRQQMVTEAAQNAHVTAVTGNFDDAQRAVKSVLANDDLREQLAAGGYQFSSANSINIGRLVPQIVYYVASYARLVATGTLTAGDTITVTVPSGNFGNVLAAYYAQQIGVPIRQFIVSSNTNNVLTDFFQTGTYDRRREFHVTDSPAMDILVSSNLERLLYFMSGQQSTLVAEWMAALQKDGHYTVPAAVLTRLQAQFTAVSATDSQTAATIRRVFDASGYVLDPHTAVGRFAYEQIAPQGITLLAATASPFKFAKTVLTALGEQPAVAADGGLQQLADKTGQAIPAAVATLFDAPVVHQGCITAADLGDYLKTIF